MKQSRFLRSDSNSDRQSAASPTKYELVPVSNINDDGEEETVKKYGKRYNLRAKRK